MATAGDLRFANDVQRELSRITERAQLEAQIEADRDDWRQLNNRLAKLQDEQRELFSRKCALASRLYKAEARLDAIRRQGCA